MTRSLFATPSLYPPEVTARPHKDRTPLFPAPEVIFCVRGAVSPLLANIYMNRFLKHWRRTDDFVILSRGFADEALAWTRMVMTKLGLALNETKTVVRNSRHERFDFLGYSFGPHHYRKDGHWYLGTSPSKRSVQRLKAKVSDILVPGNTADWLEVRDQLNRLLRGWSTYFCYGTRAPAYRAVDRVLMSVVFRPRSFSPSSAALRQEMSASVFCRSTIVLDVDAFRCNREPTHPDRPAIHRSNDTPSCGTRHGRTR
jgi:Group II intron, maturase-specific domain